MGTVKWDFKCIYISDLEKRLGGMQRDIASTVHSTQRSILLTAPTSYLTKRKRKAISFFSCFAALWLEPSHSPVGLPGIQGISCILHHWKALLTLWLLLTQTHTNTTAMLLYTHPAKQPDGFELRCGLTASKAELWKSPRRPNAASVHRPPLSHGMFQFPSCNWRWFCKLGHIRTCQAAYERTTDPLARSCTSGCVRTELLVTAESPSPSLLAPMSLWCF